MHFYRKKNRRGINGFMIYAALLLLTGCGTLRLHSEPAQPADAIAYFYAHPGSIFDPIKLTKFDDRELNTTWIKWLEILPGSHTVYFICTEDKHTGHIDKTDNDFYLKNNRLYFDANAGYRYGIEMTFYSNEPCYRIIEIIK